MAARRPLTRAALAIAAVAALALAGCASSGQSKRSTSRTSAALAKQHARRQRRTVPVLSAPAHPAARTVRVPILTYHRVHVWATELTKSIPDLTVEPGTFRGEMKALVANGYHSITQLQLFNALYHHSTLPPKPVLITVDDGYVDDVTQILPVLKRLRLNATFYVITGRMHEPGFLSAREIRELDNSGMDIGAHTRTHANLPELGPAALKSEIAGSRSDLERVLGHPVYWFAYPYGAFNAGTVAEVRRAGFLLAVTTQGGTEASALAPFTIPRIHVGRSAGVATVLSCASSGGCGDGGSTGG